MNSSYYSEKPDIIAWMRENQAPSNPSKEFEAVLIVNVESRKQLHAICFGVMNKDRADDGGNIYTSAQSFPEGEKFVLGYIRIWEQPPRPDAVLIRPIIRLSQANAISDSTRRLSRMIGEQRPYDVALAVGLKEAKAREIAGFSRIPKTEPGSANLFKDMDTNPRFAINLVTGESVPYLGESDLIHSNDCTFRTRLLGKPYLRPHHGVPYVFGPDGDLGLTKAAAEFVLEAPGIPRTQVRATSVISLSLKLHDPLD